MTAGWSTYGTVAAPSYSTLWGPDTSLPLLVGGTIPEFSTSTELARPIDLSVVWDVNRYYRDLGIGWPFKPTRPEIRRAFRMGPQDARRTFCVKQLLDRTIRERYDAAPWGMTFMDEFEWQKVKRRAMAEMAKRGMDTEDTATVREVFKALGVPVADDTPNDESQGILDNPEETQQDLDQPVRLPPFPYAYYVWKTQAHATDRDLLAAWQPLLIRAMSDLGVRMSVALGLMGQTPHEWSVGEVGYRKVAYFNRRTEPSSLVAAKVAASMQDLYHRTT